jgi:hypothetical protein
MADSEAVQLERLREALNMGATSVMIDGQQVSYRSVAIMESLIARLERRTGQAPARRGKRTLRFLRGRL